MMMMIPKTPTSSSSLLFSWGLFLLLLLLLLCPSITCSGSASASASAWGGTGISTTARWGERRRISWDTNITLLGDASLTNNASTITLTTSPPPSNTRRRRGGGGGGSTGRAIYSRPIRFLEPTTHAPASFLSRFTFSIKRPSSSLSSSGDGLAFLITSDPQQYLGGTSNRGYMGLLFPHNNSNSSATTIAVEFDTCLDAPLRDINDNHVALDVRSIFSIATADAGNAGIDLKSGMPITAWVEYRSSKKTLRVWVSYAYSPRSLRPPPNPLLVVPNTDLSNHLRQFMYVGFSASNAQGRSALHLVHQWSFRTSFGFLPDDETETETETPTSRGTCSTCSSPPDDDQGNGSYGFIDDPHSTIEVSPQTQRGKRRLIVVLGVSGALTFLFLTLAISVAGWFHFRVSKKRRKRGRSSQTSTGGGGGELQVVPARLSLDDIKLATKGFHRSKIIGHGGGSGTSSVYYEGVLPSSSSGGCTVAVKRFGNRVDKFANVFATELLSAFAGCAPHPNLLPLKGWCCEKDELILVYEYIPNCSSSLHKILHAATTTTTTAMPIMLSWDKRFKIVLGVASALIFLHQECEKKIIHRDVKTCNILLDADFNAKLGNFGLADDDDLLNEHNNNNNNRTPPGAAGGKGGSMGYLAPEYVHSGGVATEKTDVYSFGVVALEVATGRKPVERGVVLVDWVWGLWGRRKLMIEEAAADPRLEGRFIREEMRRMLIVGLSCAHPDCKLRPTMRKAIRMLKGVAPLPSLPPQKPAVRLLSHMPEASEENVGIISSPQASEDTATVWMTPCISFS